MKLNKLILFAMIGLVFVGTWVSKIKYKVVSLRTELRNVNAEIEKSTDDLNVFQAEWSYLNQPERLKALCKKYLPTMVPMETHQVISYQKIVNSELVEENPRSCDNNSTPVERDNALSTFLDKMLSEEDRAGRT
jgi:cell division protein FtsL